MALRELLMLKDSKRLYTPQRDQFTHPCSIDPLCSSVTQQLFNSHTAILCNRLGQEVRSLSDLTEIAGGF